ncbi:hypothetical protein ABW20_dc0110337 [Dactylellina cionopaga]|nr:hypothetical protein ABW20_dc0110337 [Dactylellina cionopaga]
MTGFVEGVKLLLEYGGDIHDESDGKYNCFHWLASGCHDSETEESMAKILFDAKVDYTLPGKDGKTPMFFAVGANNASMVKLLLPKYIELGKQFPDKHPLLHQDTDGNTLLHCVSVYGSQRAGLEIFDVLVTALSVLVDIKTFLVKKNYMHGVTQLFFAIKEIDIGLVKATTKINADISHRGYNGYNALDVVCSKLGDSEGDLSEERENTRDCRIGLRSILQPAYGDDPCFSIFYSTSGKVEIKATADTEDIGSYSVNVKQSDCNVIGCGIDPTEPIVFFTLNGSPLTGAYYIRTGRYFPSFTVSYPHGKFKVNFGGEPFVYKDANDPEFEWMVPEDANDDYRDNKEFKTGQSAPNSPYEVKELFGK